MSATLRALTLLLTLCGAGAALAGDLMVMDPWVREAPPGSKALAGYLVIHNHGKQDRQLVGADSAAFDHVELHRSVFEGSMARMVPQTSMPIPAGGQLELKPGDYHLMLMQPKQALKAGDSVQVTLRFDDGSSEQVAMPVKKAAAGMEGGHMHDHEHMHK